MIGPFLGAAVPVAASLAGNAATEAARGPGWLDVLRRHPWASPAVVLVLTGRSSKKVRQRYAGQCIADVGFGCADTAGPGNLGSYAKDGARGPGGHRRSVNHHGGHERRCGPGAYRLRTGYRPPALSPERAARSDTAGPANTPRRSGTPSRRPNSPANSNRPAKRSPGHTTLEGPPALQHPAERHQFPRESRPVSKVAPRTRRVSARTPTVSWRTHFGGTARTSTVQNPSKPPGDIWKIAGRGVSPLSSCPGAHPAGVAGRER